MGGVIYLVSDMMKRSKLNSGLERRESSGMRHSSVAGARILTFVAEAVPSTKQPRLWREPGHEGLRGGIQPRTFTAPDNSTPCTMRQ